MKTPQKIEKRRGPQSGRKFSASQTERAGTAQESADKQHPAIKQSTPSAYEVKERLKAESRRGPLRPLANLAAAEVALHNRSEILSALAEPAENCPTPELLINRIIQMANLQGIPQSLQRKARREIISQYRALDPIDATDSVLVQLLMAMHLSAMQALLQTRTGNPRALAVIYRHAENAAKLIIALIETRARWRNPTSFKVENVNVNSGVQAIFRNVERPNNRPDSECSAETALDLDAKFRADKDTR